MAYVHVESSPTRGLLGGLFELGWLARENLIVDHIEEMLDVGRELPSEADRELFTAEFGKFARWAAEQGLRPLPALGHVVAAYVLDLLFDGASLDDIADAVAGIKFAHEMGREYLDWAPIDAALEFAIQEKWNKTNV
jgi:hypothetical protein